MFIFSGLSFGPEQCIRFAAAHTIGCLVGILGLLFSGRLPLVQLVMLYCEALVTTRQSRREPDMCFSLSSTNSSEGYDRCEGARARLVVTSCVAPGAHIALLIKVCVAMNAPIDNSGKVNGRLQAKKKNIVEAHDNERTEFA